MNFNEIYQLYESSKSNWTHWYKKLSMPKLLGFLSKPVFSLEGMVWPDQKRNNEVHTPDIYLFQ